MRPHVHKHVKTLHRDGAYYLFGEAACGLMLYTYRARVSFRWGKVTCPLCLKLKGKRKRRDPNEPRPD